MNEHSRSREQVDLSGSFKVLVRAVDGTEVDVGATRAFLNMADAMRVFGRPCCEGHGLTLFEVIDENGRKTGEIARRCNGCGEPYEVEPA